MKRLYNFILPPHIRRSWLLRWEDLDKFNPFIFLVLLALIGAGFSMSYKLSADHSRLRDIRCLAMNIYHEARGEPLKGKYAVAAVTMNRVKDKNFPNAVCDVVYQKGWSKRYNRYVSAFSWTNDKITDIPENSEGWVESVRIAKDLYDKDLETDAKDALYYHANYIKPAWAKQKHIVAKIGRHIFYQ